MENNNLMNGVPNGNQMMGGMVSPMGTFLQKERSCNPSATA